MISVQSDIITHYKSRPYLQAVFLTDASNYTEKMKNKTFNQRSYKNIKKFRSQLFEFLAIFQHLPAFYGHNRDRPNRQTSAHVRKLSWLGSSLGSWPGEWTAFWLPELTCFTRIIENHASQEVTVFQKHLTFLIELKRNGKLTGYRQSDGIYVREDSSFPFSYFCYFHGFLWTFPFFSHSLNYNLHMNLFSKKCCFENRNASTLHM